MKYRVLWIDDEYKKQEDFIGEAEQEGIDVHAFSSHEEGMEKLDKNPEFFHAVILDAKVKKGKDDTVTGLKGLTASRDRLIEINKTGYLPYFIFTGQPDYVDSIVFDEAYGKYYIKASDNEALFRDLKEAIEKKSLYQIQKKYSKVFEVCTSKYIGESAAKHLMDILSSLENPADKFDDEKYFNGLRKVVEFVFRALNRIGILHDKCIPNGIINLTWASLFMSVNEFELKPSNENIGCSKIHFPSILSRNVKSILDITSAASHTEQERETNKLNYSEYRKRINSNYLLYSLALQVMDLLLWFRMYADANPDIEVNRSLWRPLPDYSGTWHIGSVINFNQKGFAFFKPDVGSSNTFIPPQLVSNNSLKDGDKVSVIIEEFQDTKTHQVKRQVIEIEKLR